MLSAAVGNFTQAHPGTRIELFDLSTREMLAGLEAETLDVVIAVGPVRETRQLTWTPLLRAPWKLALPRSHALARRPKITPGEVAREPLLAFSQREYPEYWESITAWMRAHHQRPRITEEYDGITSLLAAVESGLGVAIVTTRAARLLPERVRLKPLSVPPEPLCIAAGHRTDRAGDKPLAVFIQELRRAAQSFV
jgi:DNA-binding transcriptional LysR family regulator